MYSEQHVVANNNYLLKFFETLKNIIFVFYLQWVLKNYELKPIYEIE